MHFLSLMSHPDSEKCSPPAAEDGHHFHSLPLFPYSWSAYPGSELRSLATGPYRHHLPGRREPLSPGGHLQEQYMEARPRLPGAEIKSERDYICSSLESHGSYKCIKCCKVCCKVFYNLSEECRTVHIVKPLL